MTNRERMLRKLPSGYFNDAPKQNEQPERTCQTVDHSAGCGSAGHAGDLCCPDGAAQRARAQGMHRGGAAN